MSKSPWFKDNPLEGVPGLTLAEQAEQSYMRDISSRGTPIFSGTIVTTGQPHEVTAVLKGMEGMPPLPVIMPSSLPTGFVGEGSRGVPQKGQRFIGALEDTVIIILTYLNTPGSIDSSGVLDDEHIEYPGEFSLRGPASSLLFKGSGEVSIDAGMNVKQIFDKVTGRISTMAKTFVSNTIGNFSEVSFTPGDFSASGINKNTSTYVNVQRKTEDSNLSGDDNKALEDPPGMGPMPYVDKVIIKSGHLTGGLLKQDLGHIYELRTQQGRSGLPLTATTGKSVLTELRLGKQNNQTEYLTPTSGGTIISLKGKDILGAGDPIVGGNKQSFVLRWGELGPVAAGDMGEMFALRAMSGVGLSTGAGKGWASSDESSASEVFSISAGKILDQSHYRMRAKKDLYDYTHNISVTGGSEINFTAGTFTYSLTFDAAGTATLSSGAAKIELSATGANIIPIVGTGLTVGNTPVPVTGFCSLPVCLFTGAPHTTNVHSTI